MTKVQSLGAWNESSNLFLRILLVKEGQTMETERKEGRQGIELGGPKGQAYLWPNVLAERECAKQV